MGSFIRFSIIGGLGALTNLSLFFLLVDRLLAPALPVATLCYIIAATQNYIFNHYWTFKKKVAPSLRICLIYIIGTSAGLVVNLLVLEMTLTRFSTVLYPQMLGIAFGLLANFVTAKIFVFNSD